MTIQAFTYDWETQYQLIEIEQDVIEKAGQLVRKYPLRAYDSVQLASALTLYPFFSRIGSKIFTFVSSDNRLLSVAESEGIPVKNPNDYS